MVTIMRVTKLHLTVNHKSGTVLPFCRRKKLTICILSDDVKRKCKSLGARILPNPNPNLPYMWIPHCGFIIELEKNDYGKPTVYTGMHRRVQSMSTYIWILLYMTNDTKN